MRKLAFFGHFNLIGAGMFIRSLIGRRYPPNDGYARFGISAIGWIAALRAAFIGEESAKRKRKASSFSSHITSPKPITPIKQPNDNTNHRPTPRSLLVFREGSKWELEATRDSVLDVRVSS
jgi:hypothetical protein